MPSPIRIDRKLLLRAVAATSGKLHDQLAALITLDNKHRRDERARAKRFASLCLKTRPGGWVCKDKKHDSACTGFVRGTPWSMYR